MQDGAWDQIISILPAPDVRLLLDIQNAKEEEGILRADQALEDMLSSETGWLVMDWDWVD